MRVYRLLGILILIVFTSGCREKFYADIPSPGTGYLIVEGNINVGDQASTEIRLSRSSSLDKMQVSYENNASVYIEDQQNNRIELAHTDSGRYNSPLLNLPTNSQYRLHVVSSDNKEYFSAYTQAKISPAIDSVFWVAKDDGIEIQLSTHDATSNSLYYSWNFVETWEYNVPYYAVLKYDPALQDVVMRTSADPAIYECWRTSPSASIIIGSTAKLAQDLVFGKLITFVSAFNTNKLVKKYSIVVRQSVIPKEAYEYFDKMKRNTEQTGSIFDAQPSQLRGNISCKSDSSEIVVGFVTASSITEQRIFISRTDLPPLKIKTFYEDCAIETVPNNRDSIVEKFQTGGFLPVGKTINSSGMERIEAAPNKCVDCRVLGGSNVKPAFWP